MGLVRAVERRLPQGSPRGVVLLTSVLVLVAAAHAAVALLAALAFLPQRGPLDMLALAAWFFGIGVLCLGGAAGVLAHGPRRAALGLAVAEALGAAWLLLSLVESSLAKPGFVPMLSLGVSMALAAVVLGASAFIRRG